MFIKGFEEITNKKAVFLYSLFINCYRNVAAKLSKSTWMDVLLLGGLGSKTFLWMLWENVNTSWEVVYSLLIFCGLEPWAI